MQAVSAAFTAAAQAAGQNPAFYFEVAWTGNGAISAARGGPGWINETGYVINHSGTLQINPPGESLVPAGEVGNAEIRLSNYQQRFSWQNLSSPLYAHIGGLVGLTGKLVRIWQGYAATDSTPAQYVCIFTGVITAWQETTADGTVTLDCRDIGWLYLQDKRSTVVAYDQRPEGWIAQMCALVEMASATLDIGIYPLPFAWLDDESIVDEIWETAEADAGLAYFAQNGLLRFENALHWQSQLVSVWTFSEGDYKTISEQIGVDAVATEVTVEWSGRTIGNEAVLYTLDRVKRVPPGGNITWKVRFSYAVSGVFALTNDEPFRDYAASAVGGVDLTSSITMSLEDVAAQQCTLRATNASTTQEAILTLVQVRGKPLIGGPTEQETVLAVPAPYSFKRVRSVRGNPYMQTQEQGAALAGLLAVRGRRARPTWELQSVDGVPQLELGDRVTLVDVRAQGANHTVAGIVTRINWQAGVDSGFKQNLAVLDFTDLWAYSDYYIIGVTALGASGGRAYY
jgi:hypothetical protein